MNKPPFQANPRRPRLLRLNEGRQQEAPDGFRRVVVFGPPGAGKTSYVTEHARPGSLRWDYDYVLSSLTGLPVHSYDDRLISLLRSIRETFLEWVVKTRPASDVWVIVTLEIKARRIASLLGGELIEILPDHRAVVVDWRKTAHPD